jgi:hypothetical protein
MSARVQKELSKTLDARVLIVKDKKTIQQFLEGKSSLCWGNGKEAAEGWIKLAAFSPRSRGDKRTIFVCPKALTTIA